MAVIRGTIRCCRTADDAILPIALRKSGPIHTTARDEQLSYFFLLISNAVIALEWPKMLVLPRQDFSGNSVRKRYADAAFHLRTMHAGLARILDDNNVIRHKFVVAFFHWSYPEILSYLGRLRCCLMIFPVMSGVCSLIFSMDACWSHEPYE